MYVLNSLKSHNPLIKINFKNTLNLLNYFNFISFSNENSVSFMIYDGDNTWIMVQNKQLDSISILKAAFRNQGIGKVSKTILYVKLESIYKL